MSSSLLNSRISCVAQDKVQDISCAIAGVYLRGSIADAMRPLLSTTVRLTRKLELDIGHGNSLLCSVCRQGQEQGFERLSSSSYSDLNLQEKYPSKLLSCQWSGTGVTVDVRCPSVYIRGIYDDYETPSIRISGI